MRKFIITILGVVLCSLLAYAASTTTYYSLYKPASGDKNWSSQINNNFDLIDTALQSKADTASPTFTGTVSGISKSMVGLGNVDNTSDASKPVSTATQSALDLKVNTSSVGAVSGVASLDSSGKVPSSQLPSSITGSLTYKGTLDASAGSYPGSPTQGDYYIISIEGTISGTAYTVGDWAVYNGTSWDKVDNTQAVTSVNGEDGVVTLTTGDLTEDTDKNYVTDAQLVVLGNTSGSNTGDQDLSIYVQNTRTINGKALSSNIVLNTNDIDMSIYALKSGTNFTGNVGVGSASPSQALDVNGTVKATAFTGNLTGNVTGTADKATQLVSDPSGCTTGQFFTDIDSYGNPVCSTPAGAISGLTTNYVTKATSATAIGDSLIIDNGTNVGISSAVPRAKLDVNGTIYGSSTIQAASGFIGNLTGNSTTSTALSANGSNCPAGQASRGTDASGNAENCFVAGSGGWTTDDSTQTYTDFNVGIGSATPRAMLDVDGEIYGSQITLSGAGQSYCGSTYTSNCVYVGANASAVRIDPAIYTTGNLGIGSASPRQKLDVEGSVYVLTNVGINVSSPTQSLEVNGVIYGHGNLGVGSASPQAKLDVAGDIYFGSGSHIMINQTTAPTVGTPSSCGTSPSASVVAGSTDSAGVINVIAGSGSPGGCTTVVTFNRAYAHVPKIVIMASADADAGGYKPYWIYPATASTFSFAFGTAPSASANIYVSYWVVE